MCVCVCVSVSHIQKEKTMSKRGAAEALEEDEGEEELSVLQEGDGGVEELVSGGPSEKRAGRRKIVIEFIEDKSRRHITFSKRKAGIMKKVGEVVSVLCTHFGGKRTKKKIFGC